MERQQVSEKEYVRVGSVQEIRKDIGTFELGLWGSCESHQRRYEFHLRAVGGRVLMVQP